MTFGKYTLTFDTSWCTYERTLGDPFVVVGLIFIVAMSSIIYWSNK